MSVAINIVKKLINNGVYLYLEGTQLKYRTKKGAFTHEQKKEVQENKSAIINCLLKLQQKKSSPKLNIPDIKAQDNSVMIPLSFGQQRLWFIDQLGEGSVQYNMQGSFSIEGEFNEIAFRKALGALFERHLVIRTHYKTVANEVQQVILEEYELPFTQHDLTQLSDEKKAEQVDVLSELEAKTPFNLSEDLMLRLRVLNLTKNLHLILFTFHHIAGDSWSIGIFQKEFNLLYSAFKNNLENPLAPLKVQYADYARWQRDWLQGEVIESQLNYWMKQLKGIPEVHSLPLDNRRPKHQTFEGTLHYKQIDEELSSKIRALCQTHEVTMFMFLHTAFTVLLSRLSNETDIVIGSPIAGRVHSDIEELIGLFVNTLILRTDLSGGPTFSELLQKNKQMLLNAYENQHIPFEKIVEELNPVRHLNHNSVVQISFGVQNVDGKVSEIKKHGDDTSHESTDALSNRDMNIPFELKLDVYDSGEQLSMAWFYNKNIFEDSSVHRLVNNFSILLKSIVESLCSAEKEQRFDLLDMLAKNESKQLLVDWNNKKTQRVDDAFVHELFEENVVKNPRAIALRQGNKALSYFELNQRSNQLAHYLMEQGVGPNVLVALCIERSFDMVIALLGILKSGGAYVPLDPAHPTTRIDYMLNDSEVSIILTQSSLVKHLPIQNQNMICLDEPEIKFRLKQHSSDNVKNSCFGLDNQQLAYMIYTSGSTGKPKGALLSHKNVCDFLRCAVDEFLAEHIVGAIVSSPLAFDATVGSLLVPLCDGKYAELLSEGPEVLSELGERLADPQKSYLFKITPSHLEGVLAKGAFENAQSRHVIVIAGETLYPTAVKAWIEQILPNSAFINEYGPTETTVGCTTFPIPKFFVSKTADTATVPIGNLFGETDLYVLNSQYLPQSIGCIGELFVGGAGLAHGYLKQPKLTAEQFVPHPFSRMPGARLYRTGDLVRYSTDGLLEFIGRIDNQVKLRGFRIELGEIESQLVSLENIKEAVVLVNGGTNVDKQLVAYVVLDAGSKGKENSEIELNENRKSALITEFKTHLHTVLPEYMVPEGYIFMQELPLTINGKVDRKSLAAIDACDFQKEEYVAPRNTTENNLSRIWQEVLKVERVGIFDNFFSLGGHSLLATRLISAIREEFEVDLPLRVIFESPTVAGISEMLQSHKNEFTMPPIVKADRNEVLPLSYSQQRLWFIDQLGGGSVQYNMPGHFLLEGKLNVEALELSLQTLLERHEVLRTQYKVVDGEAQQVIVNEFKLPIMHFDYSQLSDEAKLEKTQELSQIEASKAFNLSEDLMLRICLIKLSNNHHLIFYTMHHIASDGWSRGILQKELTELYRAFNDKQPNPLAPLPVQYADYALWQRQWLQGNVLDQALSYWKDQLKDLPLIHNFPLDKPRPATQRFMGKSQHLLIDKKLAEQIKGFNQRHDATLFMFMHTALSVLLSRYSGEKDIVVGSAMTGRMHRDVEGLIGFFLNDLVVRGTVSENSSFVALLGQYKQTILDAYANQCIPFEMLVEELKPHRSMSHSPLFQIKLDVRNNEQSELALSDLELVDIGTASAQNNAKNSKEHSVKHDLYFSVTEQENGLSIYILYNTDLFYDETIERLSDHFTFLLKSFIELPDQSVQSLTLLSQEQEQDFLLACKGAEPSDPEEKHIHELFEEQVERTPHQCAAIFLDETLTYQQLNQEANQLAHYLLAKGLKPETVVALCLERSLDMIVGMLGVLKAGGTYVPIDPGTPEARLEFMLQDSDSQWVLTQSELMSELAFGDRRVLPIDGAIRETLLSKYDNINPERKSIGLNSTNLAYVIYTSGSTGQPKGVMVEHGGLIKYCCYAKDHYYTADLEGAIVATSYSFDLTVPSIYLPLIKGGHIDLLDESKELDYLANILATRKAAYLLRLTPSHLSGILPLLKSKQSQFPHVFIIGGEPLAVSTFISLQKIFPQAKIYNHYGPTESIVGCSLFPLSLKSDLSEFSHCPIGQTMDYTKLLVLNDELQLNPVGVPGELYVGGNGLARGYLNQAALTAQKFIPDPFSNQSEDRLYRTGDLVRWLADENGLPGNLEFIGRVDNQVKIRGLRIELGEIERVLSGLAGIRECAVAVPEASDEEKRLIAYVVLDEELILTSEDETALIQAKASIIHTFRENLATHLPDYMVPAIYMFMESLPLTTNGKLDRLALPSPAEADLLKSKYVAPHNAIEETLCELYQQVLKLEQVGIKDDFFMLGGHSLLATRLINLIRQEFEIEMPLREIFENKTISELSLQVSTYIFQKKSLENEQEIDESDDVEEVEL